MCPLSTPLTVVGRWKHRRTLINSRNVSRMTKLAPCSEKNGFAVVSVGAVFSVSVV